MESLYYEDLETVARNLDFSESPFIHRSVAESATRIKKENIKLEQNMFSFDEKENMKAEQENVKVEHNFNPIAVCEKENNIFGYNTISVYARVRPINSKDSKESRSVLHIENSNPAPGRHQQFSCGTVTIGNTASFKFKKVFDENVDQKELFMQTAAPFVQGLVEGKNGLIFAYGASNAGKTYTIRGNPEKVGLLPRALDALFDSIQTMSTSQPSKIFEVFVSYFEIYNEQIFDLLDFQQDLDEDHENLVEASTVKKSTKKEVKRRVLKLKDDNDGNPYVHGLKEFQITSSCESDDIILSGQESRRISQTMVNDHSSRSHTIFVIKLKAYMKEGKDKRIIQTSKLSIVDLAGSERTSKTKSTGAVLREAASINNSLMNLTRCLEIIRLNQEKRRKPMLVPFRNSKLTRLLQENLENGSALMIVNISPLEKDVPETIHALRCAMMAGHVKIQRGEAVPRYQLLNNSADVLTNQRISMLEQEIRVLEDKLAASESKAMFLESEIREEVAEEMEEILKNMEVRVMDKYKELEMTSEAHLDSKLEVITKTARKKIANEIAIQGCSDFGKNEREAFRKQIEELQRRLHEKEMAIKDHMNHITWLEEKLNL